MGGITLKGEKEALFTSESRNNNKSSTKSEIQPSRTQKNNNKKFSTEENWRYLQKKVTSLRTIGQRKS